MYSQDMKHRHGVAFIIRKYTEKIVLGYNAINYQIVSIRFCGQPFHIMLLKFVLQLPMQKKRRLAGFIVNFSLKTTKHASRMCCLWLKSGMPKLEKSKEENVIALFGVGNRSEPEMVHQFLPIWWFLLCQGILQVIKMVPIYMDTNRWSTQKSNWLYYWHEEIEKAPLQDQRGRLWNTSQT